jgi:hypothetical protein
VSEEALWAVDSRDLEVLREQLGREPRGVVAIPARCICGNPIVVRTLPRLDDGTPFPTSYYLSHPGAIAALSTLEADGAMRAMNERLAEDSQLGFLYLAAHESYIADRAELGEVPEIDDVSAGGMPTRVKCLHALAAQALAKGPGVNPFGDEALEAIRETWRRDRCTCATPRSY